MSVVRIDQGHSATLPHVRIQPAKGLLDLDFAGLWNYRELIHILVWRDVTVRYKQTVLGVAWAMFQPVATMLIFTAVFSVVGKIPSDGFPYPVFLYAGLLPWFYISQALSRGGTSLVGEAPLISKVYFPRLILPLSATIAPLVDLVLAFVAFLAGASIAPSIACQSVLVSRLAPAQYATEAFTWSSSFILLGLGAGMALGGWLIEASGPKSPFLAGAFLMAMVSLGVFALPGARAGPRESAPGG